jgi:hypothetical protein
VTGHNAIGKDGYRQALVSFCEDFLKGLIVAVLLEERQACIGAIEHVINITGLSDAMRPAHAGRLPQAGPPSQ